MRKRTVKSLTLFCGVLFYIISNIGLHRSRVIGGHEASLQHLIHTCTGMMTQLERYTSGPREEFAWQLLSATDHVFILSKHRCTMVVPSTYRTKITCVHGAVIDSCAPAAFLSGQYLHALRVTFSHAVVLQVAKGKRYTTIAIIEDDIKFVNRKMVSNVQHDFTKLLQSSSWSLIRLGFRPYFLQRDADTHCPSKCRCELGVFGKHFCQMHHRGCDLRSSDLYVVHSRYFTALQHMLLDLRSSNSRRIIDLHPLRSLPRQWLMIPQISYQDTLDVPVDYQLGSGALYVKKCVGPRPLPSNLLEPAITLCDNATSR